MNFLPLPGFDPRTVQPVAKSLNRLRYPDPIIVRFQPKLKCVSTSLFRKTIQLQHFMEVDHRFCSSWVQKRRDEAKLKGIFRCTLRCAVKQQHAPRLSAVT